MDTNKTIPQKDELEGLTPKQKEAYQEIRKHKGAFLVHYINPAGTAVYRLISKDRSPIRNYKLTLIDAMVSRQFLHRKDKIITL